MKRFARKLLLVVVSTLLALLAAEFAFRLLRPSYTVGIPAESVYDKELGFRHRPGARLFRTTDFQQESWLNQYGTANFQESFDEYESLVFAVGDSYTRGTGVPADQSYPFQLDLTLNLDEQGSYAKRYAVVNLGVAGYGGEQSLIAMRRAAETFRRAPSVVLYMGTDNDFEDDLMFGAGDRHSQFIEGNPRWGRAAPLLGRLTNETQIGVKVKRLLFERIRRRLAEPAINAAISNGRQPSMAEMEAHVLEKLLAAAKSQGAVLIVTWSVEGKSYEWLKSWASERGIAFADWARTTNSVRAAIPGLPIDNAHSAGHHRGWTNRLIAEEFARQLRAHGK